MIFRKAILLIHGFGGGIYDFGTLGNDLQMYLDFDVFTFTLPGHEKGYINNVTKDDWIRASEEQVERLINKGYSKIYVVGHSMGGILACHLASKYKEIKKLVLAAPAYRYFNFKDDKLDLIETLKNSPEIIKEYSKDEILSKFLKIPPKTLIEFIKLAKENESDLEKITCPTLIIRGNDDKVAPKESTDFVHNNIKSKVNILMEFDNVNHYIYTEDRKEETINYTIDFLRKGHIVKKEIINV